MPEKTKRILFIVPYPAGSAPSQRFRFEQYFDLLLARGFEYDVKPFLSKNAWSILYKKKSTLSKIGAVLAGMFRRVGLLTRMSRYGWIFIHREGTPIGPPVV